MKIDIILDTFNKAIILKPLCLRNLLQSYSLTNYISLPECIMQVVYLVQNHIISFENVKQ